MDETKKEWWEDFFSGVVLEFWRRAVPHTQTDGEVAAIKKLLQPPEGAKLLDVPCGLGRLAIPLATQGYRITGIDIAQPFLNELRTQVEKEGLAITVQYGDMRVMDWQTEFDGAYCMGGSFGYFDDVGTQSFLRSVYRALKPGARLMIDNSRIAELVLPRLQSHNWMAVDDIVMLMDMGYNYTDSQINIEYTFVHNGKLDKRRAVNRIYTYRDMCQLLYSVGFSNCLGYDGVSLNPFSMNAQRAYFVAEK